MLGLGPILRGRLTDLHQPDLAAAAFGARSEPAFAPDNRLDERCIDAIAGGGGENHAILALFSRVPPSLEQQSQTPKEDDPKQPPFVSLYPIDHALRLGLTTDAARLSPHGCASHSRNCPASGLRLRDPGRARRPDRGRQPGQSAVWLAAGARGRNIVD